MQREKNRTKNSILEYKKKSTKRVHEEDYEEVSAMQREIDELNRLKQNKNRKYSWPGQLAVYSQTIEVTLYLTATTPYVLRLQPEGFYNHLSLPRPATLK
jgi:hypothetical protein